MLKVQLALVVGGALAYSACGGPVATDSAQSGGGPGGIASGGGSASGGSASGGAQASGGTQGSGGAFATGGAQASGGASATGGGQGSGGTPGSGGAENASIFSLACGDCHGQNAEGTVDGPQIVNATAEMVNYLVRYGDANETVNNMGQVVGDPNEMLVIPATIVTDADLAEIVTWLQSFPRPTTGAELFAQNCAYCHGADGKGGETQYASAFHSAPFSNLNVTSFTTFVEQGHTSEGGQPIGPEERREYMPPFAGVLTTEEIALIYTWASAQ